MYVLCISLLHKECMYCVLVHLTVTKTEHHFLMIITSRHAEDQSIED